jgi:hypothetical protein
LSSRSIGLVERSAWFALICIAFNFQSVDKLPQIQTDWTSEGGSAPKSAGLIASLLEPGDSGPGNQDQIQ